ncbi:hypothetical protein BO94DRAFT_265156 [Aspergillus sclerotioniger CBS 115572]|uniref:Uncharacterized protein n=1 Tax=Aspergillus sclerotioniger CBS 115572 TaxID=1450535 RepID=A0A317VGY6_9EURO|nr:hypothetical protein BO94DRAFT_265156 [Aspergillus sclerotioniger CBS 115572]PWY71120.1 hypothetical protein BO94DRAFT_265156 [Aspergillus sclerotioniger CBS 115572]
MCQLDRTFTFLSALTARIPGQYLVTCPGIEGSNPTGRIPARPHHHHQPPVFPSVEIIHRDQHDRIQPQLNNSHQAINLPSYLFFFLFTNPAQPSVAPKDRTTSPTRSDHDTSCHQPRLHPIPTTTLHPSNNSPKSSASYWPRHRTIAQISRIHPPTRDVTPDMTYTEVKRIW